MRYQLTLAICALQCLSAVLADTYILNVHLPLIPSTTLFLPSASSTLRGTDRQLELCVSSERPDQWVLLHFDEPYDAWTARLSWPGSSPTLFKTELHGLKDTTKALLHISAAELSPRFPNRGHGASGFNTTFHLVLEPLILGVVPRTALPLLWHLAIFAAGAAVAVPFIIRYLEKGKAWAESGRKDKAL